MKDTHEFFGMLGKFKVGRVQALRLIGEDARIFGATPFSLHRGNAQFMRLGDGEMHLALRIRGVREATISGTSSTEGQTTF